jgi:hypothetical protein
MSSLALFDYLTGKNDLPTQDIEHLQECADCREHALQLRRGIEDRGDIEKVRRELVLQQQEQDQPSEGLPELTEPGTTRAA